MTPENCSVVGILGRQHDDAVTLASRLDEYTTEAEEHGRQRTGLQCLLKKSEFGRGGKSVTLTLGKRFDIWIAQHLS